MAAAAGNITFLRAILQNDLTILRLRDAKMNTILHTACEVCLDLYCIHAQLDTCFQAGHMFIVNFLFECGARLNAVNADGDTPCQVALRSGNADIGRFLLEEEQRERVYGCRL